jgi:hypothetical protein
LRWISCCETELPGSLARSKNSAANARNKSAVFGSAQLWAISKQRCAHRRSVPLLQETLDEEEATDDALTEIAKTAINQQAEAA